MNAETRQYIDNTFNDIIEYIDDKFDGLKKDLTFDYTIVENIYNTTQFYIDSEEIDYKKSCIINKLQKYIKEHKDIDTKTLINKFKDIIEFMVENVDLINEPEFYKNWINDIKHYM